MLIEVPAGQKKLRIDKYLAMHVENSSRTKIKFAINDGLVLVNSKKIKANHIVMPNDVIDISLPNMWEKTEVIPEDLKLDIIFEDEYLMIVNKPAGMVTHPAFKNYTGTLVNGLLYYMEHLQKVKGGLSELNGLDRAGIVHRLDKNTSGILVVAKDEITHMKLSNLFSKHDIEREYWALVWGHFKEKKGTIEKSLGRNPKDRKFFIVSDKGKRAVTEYEVIKEFEFLSLIKLNLHTGRTHQIRVHMFSMGHPVFGDPEYQGKRPHGVQVTTKLKQHINNLLEMMPRQALHAKVLGFIHPMTGEHLRFESDLPEDMNLVIGKLQNSEHLNDEY